MYKQTDTQTDRTVNNTMLCQLSRGDMCFISHVTMLETETKLFQPLKKF